MRIILLLLLVSDAVPLLRAWRANRRSTLIHALLWAGLAWAAWLGWAFEETTAAGEGAVLRYLALCLTGCAGMAVLGARRPGVSAWSFVVVGLLAVLLRPLLEGLGELHLEAAHLLFLALPLLAPVINYLPTRLGPAAFLAGAGCTLELVRLAQLVSLSSLGPLLLAASPWLAWAVLCLRRPAFSVLDGLWLDFRDHFGLVWAQRVREQFNRAAVNAAWPVVLSWGGLQTREGQPAEQTPEQLAALRALLKRFTWQMPGPEENSKEPG